MLGVYFLNRRMTIMKQIREHLKLIKILRESIPVIRNLIKSGNNFNTVTELIEKSFKLINERLLPINVALQLRDSIHEAQGKSKKRIEKEFKQLLEMNFNSMIQFNSCSGDKETQDQIQEFLKGDFREEILSHIKFDTIYSTWSFYLLQDKNHVFGKFRFLMANLLKLGLGDELVGQMKKTFINNCKRFYHLMLDSLMCKVKSKNITMSNKKEVFRYLDCEDVLPSFALMYLIFSGMYV